MDFAPFSWAQQIVEEQAQRFWFGGARRSSTMAQEIGGRLQQVLVQRD